MDEQEELWALCFPLSRHLVDGTDICEAHVVACASLLYHQSVGGVRFRIRPLRDHFEDTVLPLGGAGHKEGEKACSKTI